MTSKKSDGREFYKYAGVGFEFAGVLGVCLYLGHLADERWDSEPWGLLIGAGIGLAGGIYLLIKEGNRMMRELDSPPHQDGQPPERRD